MGTDARLESNKETVRRMLEGINQGNIGGFIQALSANYVRHCQAMPPGMQELRGREVMEQWLKANHVTFPDYREEIEFLLAEGDVVAWRSRATGTQRGALGPFPPTGKRMEIVIIGMHRFEGDKVAETWTSWDNVAALMQLGLMPGA